MGRRGSIRFDFSLPLPEGWEQRVQKMVNAEACRRQFPPDLIDVLWSEVLRDLWNASEKISSCSEEKRMGYVFVLIRNAANRVLRRHLRSRQGVYSLEHLEEEGKELVGDSGDGGSASPSGFETGFLDRLTEGLTSVQSRAVLLFLQGHCATEVARKLGVSRKTANYCRYLLACRLRGYDSTDIRRALQEAKIRVLLRHAGQGIERQVLQYRLRGATYRTIAKELNLTRDKVLDLMMPFMAAHREEWERAVQEARRELYGALLPYARTERLRGIVRCMMEGCTPAETASRLGISKASVRSGLWELRVLAGWDALRRSFAAAGEAGDV